MPWECRTVENQRREFAQAAEYCNNFSALCREFGITRHTGYKWKERYAAQQPLTNRSRRPHTSPSKTPEEVELLILAVRADNPGWGARTIRDVLNRKVIRISRVPKRSIIFFIDTIASVRKSLKRGGRLFALRRNCATKCGKQISKVSFEWKMVDTVIRWIS